MSARTRLAIAGLGAAMAVGCGHTGAGPAVAADGARTSSGAVDAATCNALGSLVDLRQSMGSSPTAYTSPLFGLVDSGEELGYARAALERLGASRSGKTAPMTESVKGLVAILESRTGELRRATENARESYAAAESTLKSASMCRGLDLREISKHQAKAEDVAIARSKACDGPLRLWAATKSTELGSEVSTSGVAAQLGELRLDKENAVRRDRLASALDAHAKRLTALKAIGGGGSDVVTAEQQALAAARTNVSEQIENAFRGCLAEAPPARTSSRTAVDPRSATVMVRPTWSGALKALGAGERRFGSGFLVRWARKDGRSETLIVTNRHVMEGALEADILLSSEIDTHDKRNPRDKTTPRSAQLVAADETDDIAILRVVADGTQAPLGALGLGFRSDPPHEQEVVVAAGFPGIGMTPSFQVTKGVVSNAHFGSDERDVGIAYLQHTAPIDPGNSGGPLLDEGGRLVGMNTAKLVGRDNVSLAIPTARIRFALRRAEEHRSVGVSHAEASCNVVLETLAAEHPTMGSIERFGLALFESLEVRRDSGKTSTRRHRDRVVGAPEGPIDDARLRAFEVVREEIETAGGVLPFETCSAVTRSASPADAPATFTATFRTRSGAVFRATLTEEHDVVRLSALARQ
jgi:S1-C subfamily serine protease